MFEISESGHKPVNLESIVEETIQGALNVRLAEGRDEIVSIYHRRLEKGSLSIHMPCEARRETHTKRVKIIESGYYYPEQSPSQFYLGRSFPIKNCFALVLSCPGFLTSMFSRRK